MPLGRRGWVAGTDTLLSSLIEAVGWRDASADLGVVGGGIVTLEAIIAARPDILLGGRGERAVADQGQALLRHPALERLYPPERRIALPDRLTVCAGPALADAIDLLSALRRSRR